ncbi:hypothetical protein CAPTEDRAFT_168454 [Capitella teleta]|uniref:RING-type domain-containing protein n=1 Tax=Capitella teleta TaxID=283909 RepID=R7UBC3_CAPTE|nr:hypothetical protein CAPTEDRAFT_168454 [Capitella teleta]|eukprot:ELU03406.1 hypothetical protein CAPTEDRAFT_168454 [Capitella teleta]
MASSIPVVKQIHRQFLSCAICLERYSRPKVLPCLHTFCEQCLQEYIPPQSLSVACPICRQQSILPEAGVSALQNNCFIIKLMEVLENPNLCLNLSELAMAECDTATMASLVCPNHQGQSFEFYCSECETAVCRDCTSGEHTSHRTLLLTEAIEEHREMLGELLKKAHLQIPAVREALEEVNMVSETLGKNYKDAEGMIQESFDALSRLLLQRKDVLLSDLQSKYSDKQRTLQEQCESLEATLNGINSCCEFTQNALKHGNETEVLLVRKEMTEKLSHLSAPDVQKQAEENEFLAFNDGDFTSAQKFLRNLGSVQSNSAIAFETVATGEGLKRCWLNRTATVNITTKDRKGELIKVGHSSFSAEFSSSSGNVVCIPDIVDNQNGTYDLSYTLSESGTFYLDIRLYGQPIRGSPFKVKAYKETESLDRPNTCFSKIPQTTSIKQRGTKRPSSSRSHGSNRRSNPVEDDLVLSVGMKGRAKGEFTNPQGVCCYKDRVLVADSNNQCVQVFTCGGDFKLRFGTRGRQVGQLQRPTGVAVTLNGNYLVADYDNKWVSVFNPDGKYLNKIGTGKLLGPKGICVDHNGHIIVVDNKASSVFVFQSNGKLLHKFGARGNEPHQFAGPHFCAINSRNDIIVSDFHNHCVKVYDCEGTFITSFGANGEGNGQFNAPTGVAVDKNDNILVADWGNSRIQVFDSSGSFLSYIHTAGGPLYGPQGLDISPEGQVIVADSGNHCLKMYKYLQ